MDIPGKGRQVSHETAAMTICFLLLNYLSPTLPHEMTDNIIAICLYITPVSTEWVFISNISHWEYSSSRVGISGAPARAGLGETWK